MLLVTLTAAGPVTPSGAQYLAAAAQARAGYRYDRALAFYAAAAVADPADSRPRCLAGQVYVLQQLLPQAVAAYRRCVTLAPGDASAWLALGDAYSAQSNEAGALDAWRHSTSLGGADGWRRIALSDEGRGNFAGAIADWTELPPSDPQALEHLGLIALERGDVQTARVDFQAARSQPSRYADEIVDGGFALAAVAPLTTSDQLGRLGYVFLAAGMPAFALSPLRRAVALDPTNGTAHAYLGWTLWVSGQRAEARSEVALAQNLPPVSSFALFAEGEIAAADGSVAQALACFKQGVALDARNPVLWSELGRADLMAADYISAELADGNAAQLSTDPAYTIAFLHLYVDHHFGLATGRARIAASSALARFPDNAAVHDLAGQIFDLLGQPTDAFYAWQQARALDPSDPAPYVYLGRYAENEGNLVTAALDLRTALALQPDGPLAARARALLAPIVDIPV